MSNYFNIKLEKVPEFYIVPSDTMDEIVSLLWTLAFTQSWDISSGDQEKAQRLIKIIEEGDS